MTAEKSIYKRKRGHHKPKKPGDVCPTCGASLPTTEEELGAYAAFIAAHPQGGNLDGPLMDGVKKFWIRVFRGVRKHLEEKK
jgi:hypothetical protein